MSCGENVYRMNIVSINCFRQYEIITLHSGARAPNSALVAMNYSDKLKGADKRCERKLHGQLTS